MAGDLQAGDTLAGYRIEALLGRGGMAAVYLAEHDRLKRKVALKVLSPELAQDESFRQRFVAESERLASVDHPNIIPVYEAGEDDSVLYIAMRYVDTTDLKRLIAQEGGLDPERALTIVSQVAAALDAAHAKGMVHRDVKPGNVLVAIGAGADGTDHAYLSDFGLTKRTKESKGLTRTGHFMGTIDYVAPEQIAGKAVDGRADQYALACVLFESLAGRPPYARDDDAALVFAHLSEPPPSLSAIRPDLPPTIDEVIATGMAKGRDDRYPYCVALARAARSAIRGHRAVTPPSGISSGETRIAEAIQERNVPASPPIGVPTPPPPPPDPVEAEPVRAAPPEREPTQLARAEPEPSPVGTGDGRSERGRPSRDGSSKRLAAIGGIVAAAIVAVAGFVIFSGGDEGAPEPRPGPTGVEDPVTGPTGPPQTGTQTGPTGQTGPTLAGLPLAESRVLGAWNMAFSPEGDASAASVTNTVWELRANCENRTGQHPCDVDAISPVVGFIQRQGKTYTGTVSGELPCGPADMQFEFVVMRAEIINGPWRAVEVRGQGTILSGTCQGQVFDLVGTLT